VIKIDEHSILEVPAEPLHEWVIYGVMIHANDQALTVRERVYRSALGALDPHGFFDINVTSALEGSFSNFRVAIRWHSDMDHVIAAMLQELVKIRRPPFQLPTIGECLGPSMVDVAATSDSDAGC
jgi:hypothetical protein